MTIYCNMVMIHIVSPLLGNNYYRKCIELLYSYFEVLMLILPTHLSRSITTATANPPNTKQ